MGTKPYNSARRRYLMRAIVAAALAAVVLVPSSALAAPANQQGTSRTVVLQSLSFVRVQDLEFGDIIPSNTAGTVRLRPDGTRTSTGGVILVGSSHQPARFAGFGSRNQRVLISLSSNTIQITGPGAPMTVSLFEIDFPPKAILTTAPRRFRIRSTTGLFEFPLGATLAVGANQVAGSYSGTFSITLDYQ